MKRKIIKQGRNTLTVTLPSSWARKHGIACGDEIDMLEQEKNLVLRADKGPALLGVDVDISGLTPSVIWRYILSSYRAGYDEIRIMGIGRSKENIRSAFSVNSNIDHLLNKKTAMISPTEVLFFATSSTMRTSFNWDVMSPMEVVSACVNRLIGMEIVDQKENCCIIKELSETTYKEFDNALRRIFLLLKLESEYVISGLKGNKDLVKSIHIVDTNLDRFEDFCLRVLNKKGYSDFRKTQSMYTIIFISEMLGDELRKIGQHLIEKKPKVKMERVLTLASMMHEQLNRFYNVFYKFDKEKVLEIYEEDRKMSMFVMKNYNTILSKDEDEVLHHLKKVGIFILNLLELRIDLEF